MSFHNKEGDMYFSKRIFTVYIILAATLSPFAITSSIERAKSGSIYLHSTEQGWRVYLPDPYTVYIYYELNHRAIINTHAERPLGISFF